MPPTMAQGANQALEDAWALTHSLGDLRGYERVPDGAATKAFVAWTRLASSYLLTRS